MASNTPRLNLYKKDPVADGNDTFNITTMLNDNWDRIDQNVTLKSDFDSHLADYVKHPAYAVASGSANAYSVTLNPAPTSYVEGMAIAVKINVDNTGASTINVNGLGTKAIKKPNGNDVSAGNLKAGSIYTLRYNGTNFILQGEGGSGNAQPSDVLSGKTFTNDSGEQTGTMPNRGAMVITPNTFDQAIPQGYHNGSGIVKGDPDLIAANIKQGIDIFGIVGTLEPGKRFRSGTVTTSGSAMTFVTENGGTNNDPYAQVTGLPFQPSLVLLYQPNGSNCNMTAYKNDMNLWSNGSVKVVRVWGTNVKFYRDYDMSSQPLITSNSFILPFGVATTNINWIAFE
jgi:hypothetical protein